MSVGPVGPTGPQGTPGENWFSGSGVPSGTLAGSIVGDWYLNTDNGDVYEKTGTSAWTLRANIKGPQGIQGIQGPQGIQGIQGIQGTPGEKWFAGVGVPAGGLAGTIVGDWYLDTSTGDVYEKTGASTWTVRANIKGPQGIQGIQGIQGPIGNTGPSGSTAPHAPNHQLGGSDPLTNNAWLNTANIFSQSQTFTKAGEVQLTLNDTSQIVNGKIFRIVNALGVMYIQSMNDDGVSPAGGYIAVGRAGNLSCTGSIAELARSVPIGYWTDVAYNPANFTATGGTLSGVGQNFFHYMLVGKTMWLSVGFSATLTGNASTLNVVLPLSVTIARYSMGTALILNASLYGIGHIQGIPGNTYVGIQTGNAANWTAGAVLGYFTIALNIN
jgi:hypothetical protein